MTHSSFQSYPVPNASKCLGAFPHVGRQVWATPRRRELTNAQNQGMYLDKSKSNISGMLGSPLPVRGAGWMGTLAGL